MRDRHVQCPICSAILKVPPGLSNCYVRCGTCTHRFRLPRRIAVTDDAIADWLYQVRPDQDEEQAEEVAADQEAVSADEGPVSGQTAVLPAISENISLVHVDDRGATFEFSAHSLTKTAFRCAMPRRCIRCGRRSHSAIACDVGGD